MTPTGAKAEYKKYLHFAGAEGQIKKHKRELVSLQITVEPVMDLTDPEVSPVPIDAPFLIADDEESLEMCKQLADSLRSQGYAAIITPSSAKPKAKNLVIYFDGTAKYLDIDEGGDREPI